MTKIYKKTPSSEEDSEMLLIWEKASALGVKIFILFFVIYSV